ncbi:hypothetical protein ACFLWX_03235 [Chloroflexota bacterium]
MTGQNHCSERISHRCSKVGEPDREAAVNAALAAQRRTGTCAGVGH